MQHARPLRGFMGFIVLDVGRNHATRLRRSTLHDPNSFANPPTSTRPCGTADVHHAAFFHPLRERFDVVFVPDPG